MTTPAPRERCPACSFEIEAGLARCSNCNAALGELAPCPHCRAKAGTSPHPELRHRCDVCGGPRIPRVDGVATSGKEIAPLREAEAARKSVAAWRSGAVVTGLATLVGSGAALFLTLLFGLSLTLMFLSTVVIAPLALVCALAYAQSKKRHARIGPAIDAAWISVATDVAQATTGQLVAADLAKKLQIEEAQAEELLALLDANDVVQPRPVRIAPSPPPPSDGAASAEQQAEEEAAAIATPEARVERR